LTILEDSDRHTDYTVWFKTRVAKSWCVPAAYNMSLKEDITAIEVWNTFQEYLLQIRGEMLMISQVCLLSSTHSISEPMASTTYDFQEFVSFNPSVFL